MAYRMLNRTGTHFSLGAGSSAARGMPSARSVEVTHSHPQFGHRL